MPKFLLTGYADKENAVKAINDVGLYQYVEKTWENQDLKLAIQQGLEKRVLLEMLEKRIDLGGSGAPEAPRGATKGPQGSRLTVLSANS